MIDAAPASLYVIEIAEDRVKIGYSTAPRERLAQHRSLAAAHGCTPGREWASPRGSGTEERERQLIEFCTAHAREQHRFEYFAGVDFLLAMRRGAELCHDAAALEWLDREAARWSAGVRLAESAAFEAAVAGAGPGAPLLAATVDQAAAWLDVPQHHVQRWIASGELVTFKAGRTARIPVHALRQLLARADQAVGPSMVRF